LRIERLIHAAPPPFRVSRILNAAREGIKLDQKIGRQPKQAAHGAIA
jgi:hypothetical protein